MSGCVQRFEEQCGSPTRLKCHHGRVLLSGVSRCRPACRCCPGFYSAVTRTCWQTPAGPCPTSLTVPTTKSRPSSIPASADALWNYSCKLLARQLFFLALLEFCAFLVADVSPCVLRHTDYKVASPALRAVGNIVTGDDIQTQVSSG